MGSRRGALLTRLGSFEETERSSSRTFSSDEIANATHLPVVRLKSKRNNADTVSEHWRCHQRRRPSIHPALTDFGPDSLQRFIKAQLEKLRRSTLDLEDHNQQLRDWALVLVNAEHGIDVTRKDGKTTFELMDPAVPRTSSKKDKGKAKMKTTPKTTKGKTLQDAQVDGAADGVTSTRTSELPPATYARRRVLESNFLDPFSLPIPGSSRGVDEGNGNEPNTFPSNFPFTRPRQIPSGSSGNIAPFDNISNQGASNKIDASRNTSTLSLSRSASFKTHASISRGMQRLKSKLQKIDTQGQEGLPRRRKTPSTSSISFDTSADPLDPTGQSPIARGEAGRASVSPVQDRSLQLNPLSTAAMDLDAPTTLPSPADNSHQPPNLATLGGLNSSYASAARDLAYGYGAVEDEEPDLLDSSGDDWIGSAPVRTTWYDSGIDDVLVQRANFDSLEISDASHRPDDLPGKLLPFDYQKIVPEQMPCNVIKAALNRGTIWDVYRFDSHRGSAASKVEPFTERQVDPRRGNFFHAPNKDGDYPRHYDSPDMLSNLHDPPFCPPSTEQRATLPFEIWGAGVLEYLSSAEVRTLRLVCKSIAEDLEPYVFRNVVTNFGPTLFNLNASSCKDVDVGPGARDSMLKKHGSEINKFGIAFEFDAPAMTRAPHKTTETIINAWFGSYKWPVPEYPYFEGLEATDALLDDPRQLLSKVMKHLTNCSELAISVDSGHGWLEGPDRSDLALYRHQARGRDKVFGKTFSAADRSYEIGMKEFFQWAQINTINELTKYLNTKSKSYKEDIEKLRSILIRQYDSYREQEAQPDFEQHLHTGGIVQDAANQPTQQPAQQPAQANNPLLVTNNNQSMWLQSVMPSSSLRNMFSLTGRRGEARQQRLAQVMDIVSRRTPPSNQTKDSGEQRGAVQPQWPLIFNGFNLSGEVRGDSAVIQDRVARPCAFPLLPGYLTEAQAQWLMETSWIQRTFLSSYIDAVQLNSGVLKNVHSLRIAKLSSNLLPSITQKGFWTSLKGLRKITILVKPDWRVEHTPGDKLHQNSMRGDVIDAVVKFTHLLQDNVAQLENLYSLHIGYVGGGEHQVGMFGRNQHVMPAPIVTSSPRAWLIGQNPGATQPDTNSMITFPHIRTLTFENCWFSPLMLETFMEKSRDTSLHNLVLDSVSLTARVNSTRTDGPLRTVDNSLNCLHSSSAWLQETVPANASWVSVLDKITPGRTLLDRKYDLNMINEEESPRPEPQFRGNIQQITLKSCGYVKIQGVGSQEFNQNELVAQNPLWTAIDSGLRARASRFSNTITVPKEDLTEEPSLTARQELSQRRGGASFVASTSREKKEVHSTTRFIMQAGRAEVDGVGGLSVSSTGTLTQCIHPIEKRILEQCWGMKFGWGDDMKRWEAVEDGWFIGGTGRFGGEVFKDDALQRDAVSKLLASTTTVDTDDSQSLNSNKARRSNSDGSAWTNPLIDLDLDNEKEDQDQDRLADSDHNDHEGSQNLTEENGEEYVDDGSDENHEDFRRVQEASRQAFEHIQHD